MGLAWSQEFCSSRKALFDVDKKARECLMPEEFWGFSADVTAKASDSLSLDEVEEAWAARAKYQAEEQSTESGRSSPVGSLSSEAAAAEAYFDEPADTQCVRAVCDQTLPGERLALVGEDDSLGAWDVSHAIGMSTSADSFPVWFADVACPPAGSAYKLLIVSTKGDVKWEPIQGNRSWPSSTSDAVFLATYGRGQR